MKGYSHRQEALGFCTAISPLPGLIWQEILAVSSLISVHKEKPTSEVRQRNVGEDQWDHLPRGAPLSEKSLWERKRDVLLQVHWPPQSSRHKGSHMDLDRFEGPCDIPSSIFPTSPHARVSDPLSFHVLKPICNYGGYRRLGSASYRKTLWGGFIHLH